MTTTTINAKMPTTRSQTLTRKTVFRFQDLPGEQRNTLYRALLDDVTTPTKAFDLWDEGFPGYDQMAAYTALIRTCRAGFEVSTIFEKEYLPVIPWYFNDMRTLWDSSGLDSVAGLRNGGGKYVLRAPIGRESGLGVRDTGAIVGDKNYVGLDILPFEIWTMMEELLEKGLNNVTEKVWKWNTGAAVEAKISGAHISCTIHAPLAIPAEEHPMLIFYSKLALGGHGETTATIEGKLKDLIHIRKRHDRMERKRLWMTGMKPSSAKRRRDHMSTVLRMSE